MNRSQELYGLDQRCARFLHLLTRVVEELVFDQRAARSKQQIRVNEKPLAPDCNFDEIQSMLHAHTEDQPASIADAFEFAPYTGRFRVYGSAASAVAA